MDVGLLQASGYVQDGDHQSNHRCVSRTEVHLRGRFRFVGRDLDAHSEESLDVILGELDPEIYGKVYSKYPQSISHIFIRDISTVTPSPPAAVERFIKAFEGVPNERWTVFREPNAIETNVERMIM